MHADQPSDALDKLARLVQLAQDATRHALALVVVSVERDLAVLDTPGRGFGDVVQQPRPTQGQPRRRAIQDLQRMVEDVLVSAAAELLLHSAQIRDLRQTEIGQTQVTQQQDAPRGRRSQQQLFELVADAFATDRTQSRGGLEDCPGGLRVDVEAEAACKAHRAEQAQRIFPEALERVADCSNASAR